MIRLIRPTPKYKQSFLAAIKEFQKEGKPHEIHRKGDEPELYGNFAMYVRKVRARERGLFLEKQHVPETIYWLVDDRGFIGESALRHKLSRKLLKIGGHIGYCIRPSRRREGNGQKILSLTLKQARKKGFKKVLLTCNETNIGSKKIIESNGGIFKNAITVKKNHPKRLRYWIHL